MFHPKVEQSLPVAVTRNKETAGRGVRPTIGMLLERPHAYNFRILCGVADVLQEQGADLITFAGGPLRDPDHVLARTNLMYDLVNPNMVDGLIILTATLGHYVSPAKVREFCRRYMPLPMISLGTTMENIPSVVVDNHIGLHALMVHLIVDHGYRRIAFIKGPENNRNAQQRYQTYITTMTQYGLSLDPELIVPGDFSFESSLKAVEILLDRRKVEVEVIMTCCDGVALAVLEALRRRDIAVPGAIVVTGFDDSEASRYTVPPLTTVHQPIYGHGRRAAEMILAQLRGETIPEILTLPSELIIRQSCGCLSQAIQQARVEYGGTIEVGPTRPMDLAARLALQQESILAEMSLSLEDAAAADQSPVASGLVRQFLDAFLDELKAEPNPVFLATLVKILQPVIARGGDISPWQAALSAMRRRIWPYLADQAVLVKAENLWYQAQALLGEMIQQAQTQRNLLAERQTQVLREIGRSLVTTFDLEHLVNTVAKHLPQLGIQSGYICVFEPGLANSQALPPEARLILAYTERERLHLETETPYFLTLGSFPDGLLPRWRQYSLLYLPLYFRDNLLGFAGFEVGPHTDTIYEALQSQICSALQGALLVQQVQNHALDLEIEVLKRTAALKAANKQLEVYASELGIKNAELERFTYTVSHDLKSPLITIQGFLGMLEKDALAGDLELMQEDTRHIRDAVKQMNALLNDLLELSRIGRVVHPLEAISLYELVQEAVELVTGQIVARGVKVDISPHLPMIFGDRPRLLEVLQNLIDNAVKYMDNQPHPRIEIGVRLASEAPIYYVQDNGMGIDPRYHEKIFGLFERLQADGQGTGIGLALAKRIIELHKGRIWVESEGPGWGSTFCFTLPQSEEQVDYA